MADQGTAIILDTDNADVSIKLINNQADNVNYALALEKRPGTRRIWASPAPGTFSNLDGSEDIPIDLPASQLVGNKLYIELLFSDTDGSGDSSVSYEVLENGKPVASGNRTVKFDGGVTEAIVSFGIVFLV